MAIRRSNEVTFEVVDGKAMLIDPAGKELITLNPVGTLVWEALDGTRELPDVVDHVLRRVTGATRDQVKHDLLAFVDELSALGLVVELESGSPASP